MMLCDESSGCYPLSSTVPGSVKQPDEKIAANRRAAHGKELSRAVKGCSCRKTEGSLGVRGPHSFEAALDHLLESVMRLSPDNDRTRDRISRSGGADDE